MSKTVGIIGLGLLGGSLALALKAYTDYEVVGYARRQEICDMALADKAVSKAWTNVDDVIRESDIVVFALPPETNAKLFAEKAHLFTSGQIVTDVSSAKDDFVASVYQHIPDGVIFVSTHPMAGSEKGGYEVATKDLFQKMGWIVLDDPEASCYDAAVADELANMGQSIGSRIERVQMKDHDAFLAMVSHMPHLMASIMTVVAGGDELGELRMRLSAGGFRDSTRTAGGLPSMWKEIIFGNRKNVLQSLELMEQEVNHVRQLLARDDDGVAIEEYLGRAKQIRERLPYLTGQVNDANLE